MPDSGTTALIGTAAGGVIAGAAGWLNGFAQNRRDRRKEHLTAKRTAYLDFLRTSASAHGAAHEPMIRITFGPTDDKHIPVVDELDRRRYDAELSKASADLATAQSILNLYCPRNVGDAADDLRDAVVDLMEDVTTLIVPSAFSHPKSAEEWHAALDKAYAASRAIGADDGPMAALEKQMKVDLLR